MRTIHSIATRQAELALRRRRRSRRSGPGAAGGASVASAPAGSSRRRRPRPCSADGRVAAVTRVTRVGFHGDHPRTPVAGLRVGSRRVAGSAADPAPPPRELAPRAARAPLPPPSASSRRSRNAEPLTASTTSSRSRPARSSTLLRRVALRDPRGVGVEQQPDAQVARAEAGTRVAQPSMPSSEGGSTWTPVARTARMRSTRNIRSPCAVAPRREVPRAEGVEHPPRVDDPGRHLVAGEGVVVDLDPLVARPRPPQRVERGRPRPRPPRAPSGRAERGLELAERGGQRTVGVGARDREQRTPGGEQRRRPRPGSDATDARSTPRGGWSPRRRRRPRDR